MAHVSTRVAVDLPQCVLLATEYAMGEVLVRASHLLNGSIPLSSEREEVLLFIRRWLMLLLFDDWFLLWLFKAITSVNSLPSFDFGIGQRIMSSYSSPSFHFVI